MYKKISVFILILVLSIFVIDASAKTRVYLRSVLTGGTTGALDALDGDLPSPTKHGDPLNDGDKAIVITLENDSNNPKITVHYVLDADSGLAETPESPGVVPTVITPDTNAGTKRWILALPDKVRTIDGAIGGIVTNEDSGGSDGWGTTFIMKINNGGETLHIESTSDDTSGQSGVAKNARFMCKFTGYGTMIKCTSLANTLWFAPVNGQTYDATGTEIIGTSARFTDAAPTGGGTGTVILPKYTGFLSGKGGAQGHTFTMDFIYHFHAQDFGALAGTQGIVAGLLLDEMTTGTTNYQVYSLGGDSLFNEGALKFTGDSAQAANTSSIGNDTAFGLVIHGGSGSSTDFAFQAADGTFLLSNATGTSNLSIGAAAGALTMAGKFDSNASTATCTDGAGKSSLSLSITNRAVKIDNNDVDGCDITLFKTGQIDGVIGQIWLVETAGGTVDIAHVAGVQEVYLDGTITIGLRQKADVIYDTDKWLVTQ